MTDVAVGAILSIAVIALGILIGIHVVERRAGREVADLDWPLPFTRAWRRRIRHRDP